MKHVQRICQVVSIALLASLAWGEPAESEKAAQESVGTLTARVEQLTAENEALRAENAALKEKLAAMEKTAASRPTTRAADLPVATFELGETTKLGNYQFRVPAGWMFQAVKDNKLGALYRSQDRAAVIFLVVRPK